VYRAAAALPFTAQAQESVRRVAVLMSTTPDEPESMWWLGLAYAPHLRPEGRRRLFALDAPRCLFC